MVEPPSDYNKFLGVGIFRKFTIHCSSFGIIIIMEPHCSRVMIIASGVSFLTVIISLNIFWCPNIYGE